MDHLYESNRHLLYSKFRSYSFVIFFLLITRIVFIPRNFYLFIYLFYLFIYFLLF